MTPNSNSRHLESALSHRCGIATAPGSLWLLLAVALIGALISATASGQTPTLVQHYYTGANAPPRGLDAPNYTFRLPNKVLAGNCLVLFLDYPSGSSVTSIMDDGGNAWPAAPAVVANPGAGRTISAAYVLPDVAGGTRVITVNFNTAVAGVKAVFLEYYNVATSTATGSTATRTSAAAPTIASNTLVPAAATAGNLVLNYAIDNEGQVGGQSGSAVTSWSAGQGWTMLGGDINNAHDTSSFALQARIADGTNFVPTMSATQGSSGRFNSIAVELRAAPAGTAPAPGIRILKQQFYVHTALAVPGTWTEFFPSQGNLLAAENILAGSTTAALSDSNGNTWTRAHTNSGAPAMQYAQAATTSSSLRVSIPLTTRNSNTTIVLFDITGAQNTNVLAQAVTIEDTDASGDTVANNAPTITPLFPNGLILVATEFGQGPVTGFAAGAPPTALFMPVTYPGETDLDTFDNADAYAHNYYGTDLSLQRYSWTMLQQPSNSWAAAAVEFRGADIASPSAPSGLTAASTGATQINLAWNPPSGGNVSSYQVERCQGSGCANFAQIANIGAASYGDAGLAAGTTYRYRVRAIQSDNSITGYSNIATAATPAPSDTSPPTAPGNFSATAAGPTQINLSWSAASDNVGVSGYRVERCQGAGCTAFVLIATTASTVLSDADVVASTSYSYRVRANDAAGNAGAYSNAATATTPAAPDTTRPSTPTGLAATAAGSTRINLAWNASTDNVGVSGYRVFRCQGSSCSSFAQIATTASASYSDTGVTTATTYRYRVQAVDAAGNVSANSSTVSATTPAQADTSAPSVPAGLTATAAANQTSLSWSAATDNVGVTGYRMERCQGAGCTAFTQIATPSTTTFNDTGVSAATTYSYRVRAVDAAGNLSGYSNVVSATTPATAPPGNGTIAFVQGNYATPQPSSSQVTVKYTATQAAGDLNVVIVGWSDTRAVVNSVVDSMGNVYTLAAGPTRQSDAVTQAIYYAKNIVGAAANANTVTVSFSASATYPDIRVLSYRGLDRTNPLAGSVGASGNNANSDSGPLTIASNNVLLVAGNTVWSTTSAAGAGFSRRMITAPNGDLGADRTVSAAGSYSATATLSGPGPWVMQVVAFKAANP